MRFAPNAGAGVVAAPKAGVLAAAAGGAPKAGVLLAAAPKVGVLAGAATAPWVLLAREIEVCT